MQYIKVLLVDVRHVASCLAPYPWKECKLWPSLTCFISSDLCNRLASTSRQIGVSSCVLLDQQSDSLIKEEHLIRFTKIPPRIPPTGSSPQDITKYSIDSSHRLEQLIIQHSAGMKTLIILYTKELFYIGRNVLVILLTCTCKIFDYLCTKMKNDYF